MWIRWILLKRQRERDGGGDGSELEAVVESYLGSAIQSPPRSAPSFCACIFVCAASRTIRRRNLSPPQPPPHPPPPVGTTHAERIWRVGAAGSTGFPWAREGQARNFTTGGGDVDGQEGMFAHPPSCAGRCRGSAGRPSHLQLGLAGLGGYRA
jgi:hypothetical protein